MRNARVVGGESIRQFSVPEPNTGCWLWLHTGTKSGYGTMSDRRLAHRVSYETFVGAIPSGACVLHSCDVRACVNPEHLFLGSIRDNQEDMAHKGRGRRSRAGLPRGVQRRRGGTFYVLRHWRKRHYYLGTYASLSEAAAASLAWRPPGERDAAAARGDELRRAA